MAANSETKIASLPFPHHLFQIWENQKTGVLRVKPGRFERSFCFIKGDLAAIKKYFPEKDFLDWLIETKKIEPPLRFNRHVISPNSSDSTVAILIEQGFLSSPEVFELINNFLNSRLADHFELASVEHEFTEENFQEEDILFKGMFTPSIILNGIRKMSRLDSLVRYLPSEKELIFRQVPTYSSKLNLMPPEIYLWNLLQVPRNFSWLLEQSWLGPTETKKVILALSCLKLVDFNRNLGLAENNGRPGFVDLEKCLIAFNERCSFIYKYVAKQLGPVAFNLIEKCYREVQEYLDPIFLNLEIKPDGSFEPRAMLKFSLNELSAEEKKALLRGFDEILTAELLMVKKNLGNQHEAILVKNLKRTGETT